MFANGVAAPVASISHVGNMASDILNVEYRVYLNILEKQGPRIQCDFFGGTAAFASTFMSYTFPFPLHVGKLRLTEHT